MDQLVLYIAAAGQVLGIFWLGTTPENALVRVLVRPAVLALLGLLVLIVAVGEAERWPYALVATAAVMGLWEAYVGAYRMLGAPASRFSPTQRVKVCGAWLVNALANLVLLNMASYLAFPETFDYRGGEASVIDVVYLTLLTFASGGFGDVLPHTGIGKVLVMITSMAGLLYATILFAAVFHALGED